MSSLFERISGRVKMTSKSFRSDLNFSLKYALLRVGSELGGRLHLRGLSRRCTDQKNRWIETYLKNSLASVLGKYQMDDELGRAEANAPIWVCWWTGEETAPLLVKQCIASTRRNANGHPVHLITKDNYAQYIDVPEYILKRFAAGKMCVAHFSDYLRFSLLAKYGGLWLDATIFCSQRIPDYIFKMPLFTCKGRTGQGEYWSDFKWTTFCFGGYQGCVLFRALRDSLDAYWKVHKVAIDYLMLDYVIKLLYTGNVCLGKTMDAIPDNNLQRDDLQAAMNAALPEERWGEVVRPETVLYKLSWREKYQEETPDGKKTVYRHLMEM